MSEWRAELGKLIDELKTERDELRLQMHLAKADLTDEWDQIEQRMEHLKSKAAAVAEASGEGAKDVWEAAQLVGGEIRDAFARIRKAF